MNGNLVIAHHLRDTLVGLVLLGMGPLASCLADLPQDLRDSRTFRASFDEGVDADEGRGDVRLYTLVDKEKKGVAGLPDDGSTVRTEDGGLSGGALKFTQRNAPWIFFQAKDNVPYEAKDWSGTVSCWLKLDPEEDLEPGYSDPIQVTTRAWNDGAFFVDFDKEGDPRDFRLGAFADLSVWNPGKKEVAESERPLLKVPNPPFGRDRWTHVAFTWERFNTGEKDGVATFYLNGHRQGSIEGWNQQFTWKLDEGSRLYLGLNYIGLLDEVSCFDRALTQSEIDTIYREELGEARQMKAALIDGTGPGWRSLGEADFVNVNCSLDTWSWEDGMARCSGQPVGVIRTHRPVTNCEIVLEWRHLKSGGNSGVFLWASEASIKQLEAGQGRLPHGIEVQILDHGYTEQYERQHQKKADWFTSHGDVFPTGPAKMTPFLPVAPNGKRSFPSKSLSKGVNAWNHYYIRAINGEVRLWVNGEEVSGGTDCQPASGYLCLESEGSPIEFRRLRLRELP